mmetsp:Transcript_28647/g.57417  ORF Transcript_28647/g.57417 Transcript_28647/m.57417 type:complete len:87 (-) Transcript_28647:224-484(-)
MECPPWFIASPLSNLLIKGIDFCALSSALLFLLFFFTSMVKLELNMRESELMKRGLHELLVYSLNKILGEDIDKSIHKTLFCIIVF